MRLNIQNKLFRIFWQKLFYFVFLNNHTSLVYWKRMIFDDPSCKLSKQFAGNFVSLMSNSDYTFDRFGQIYNRPFYHHVQRAASIRYRSRREELYASWSAAAACWLLPAATTAWSYGSTWANGHLLSTCRTATAATSATGHHSTSSSDRGTNSNQVIYCTHRHLSCCVLLLLWPIGIHRFHLRE